MSNSPWMREALVLVLGLVAIGCSTEPRTYDISVKNDSSHALTLVLARSDKPDSEIWMTPEQVAHDGAPTDKQWGLGVLPPGKTANADKVMGAFAKGAQAWLRLYEGDLSVGEMVKINAGNPKRQDITLQTGDNQVVVRDDGEHVRANRVGN